MAKVSQRLRSGGAISQEDQKKSKLKEELKDGSPPPRKEKV